MLDLEVQKKLIQEGRNFMKSDSISPMLILSQTRIANYPILWLKKP
jgi:hypothetical protein